MPKQRSKSADGFARRLRSYFLGNFQSLWRGIARSPWLSGLINKFIIDTASSASRNRPHPFSTLEDYTSWESLTDKRYLKPLQTVANAPPIDDVAQAFLRSENQGKHCEKSTLLFPVFAQYLTDGFLRTNMDDRVRTTSNHDIDLSPLYGRTREQTQALRLLDNSRGRRGRLRCQDIDGEDYPEELFEDDGVTVRRCFLNNKGEQILDAPLGLSNYPGQGRERHIFAVGGDRANATPMICLMNTLLLREHNRLAGHLENDNPSWDDERVFQTARSILVVMYIKIVIEEYINHISSACFRLKADPKVTWKAHWNRPNWMTVEFALLYRWHPLIPNTVSWRGHEIVSGDMVLDNRFAIKAGLTQGFQDISRNKGMALTLFNTPAFLLDVEKAAINQARTLHIPKFNAYRKMMGMGPIDTFDQMTGDEEKASVLKSLYKTPDEVEFYVGLFAEDANVNTPMPSLMGAMVALDAFTQALTNPLLSQHVYTKDTFTTWGLHEISETSTISDLVLRNADKTNTDGQRGSITMTQPGWVRSPAPF